jgi:hypothetical protein
MSDLNFNPSANAFMNNPFKHHFYSKIQSDTEAFLSRTGLSWRWCTQYHVRIADTINYFPSKGTIYLDNSKKKEPEVGIPGLSEVLVRLELIPPGKISLNESQAGSTPDPVQNISLPIGSPPIFGNNQAPSSFFSDILSESPKKEGISAGSEETEV